jgi:peptide deformylase
MGHPVLRAKARPLEKSEIRGAAVQKLIDDMIDTMAEYHGVGLAAPQVHEGLRIFVAALDEADEDEDEAAPLALINPEITVIGSDQIEDWEGCLSIPDVRGCVSRAEGRSHRAARPRFPGAGHPARDRSPGRRAVLRSDADLRVADLPRRILPLLGKVERLKRSSAENAELSERKSATPQFLSFLKRS